MRTHLGKKNQTKLRKPRSASFGYPFQRRRKAGKEGKNLTLSALKEDKRR